MEWWITQSGITQGPASWAGNPLYAGPYKTEAAARAAFQAGVRPGSSGSQGGSGGQWWVGIRGTTIKVFQSASKPAGYSQVLGPYPTQAEAQQVANTIGQPVTNRPTGNPSVPSGLTAIGDFFTKIGQRDTWIRIVKVAVGAIMIIAGLAKIGLPPAEKIAAKLPKVIPA